MPRIYHFQKLVWGRECCFENVGHGGNRVKWPMKVDILLKHRSSQGGQRGHAPPIFRKCSYFVLWETFL